LTTRTLPGGNEGAAVLHRELTRGEREAMGPWVAGLRSWQWFVTFTYDPVKVVRGRRLMNVPTDTPVRVGLQKLRRDMERFVGEVALAEKRCFDLAAGFEPHESGSLHAHGLAFLRGGATGNEIRSMHGSWFERHGFLKVEPVTSLEAVAVYVAKYCTKTAGEMFFSRRLSDAL